MEYEADPRQAERLLDELGFSGDVTSVVTPGVKFSYQDHVSDVPLEGKLHTPFRGSAARGNYLSADRVDIQYAVRKSADPCPHLPASAGRPSSAWAAS